MLITYSMDVCMWNCAVRLVRREILVMVSALKWLPSKLPGAWPWSASSLFSVLFPLDEVRATPYSSPVPHTCLPHGTQTSLIPPLTSVTPFAVFSCFAFILAFCFFSLSSKVWMLVFPEFSSQIFSLRAHCLREGDFPERNRAWNLQVAEPTINQSGRITNVEEWDICKWCVCLWDKNRNHNNIRTKG